MTEQNLLEELRLADPAPVDAERPEGVWTSAVVLRQLEQRRGTMQTLKKDESKRLAPKPNRTRKLLARAAAVVVAIVAAGIIIATVGGSGGSDVASAEDVTVTFDGTSCNYQGPAELPLDTRVTWTFINETPDPLWGMELWLVPEGTTVEEIGERGIFDVILAQGNGLTGTYGGVGSPNPEGVPGTIIRTLDTSGPHAVVCVDQGRDHHYATLFTVTGN